MAKRWLVGLVAVVAVVAVGGIGFAAFTSSAYITANGNAGNFYLFWNGISGTGSQSYVTCTGAVSTTTNTSDTLTVNAGNLAPGDYCTFTSQLKDGGSLPGNVYDAVVSASGTGGCVWFYNDNFQDHSYPPPETPQGPVAIGPSSPIAYSANFGLESGNGNGCQLATISITIDVTATAT
jgi:hypothetical protein